ncbi:MAG: ribosomal protein S18-alanine N-acetyltransferase [Chloroflexota bacterium]
MNWPLSHATSGWLFFNELTDNPLAHYQVLARQESGGREKIIGHTGFWLVAGEAHIVTIAVAPAERGHGLGELLLLNLLTLVCEVAPSRVALEVRASNQAAHDLYLKYRFTDIGRRRRYYRDTGEDAIVMEVDLTAVSGYCTWLGRQADRLFARLGRADLAA